MLTRRGRRPSGRKCRASFGYPTNRRAVCSHFLGSAICAEIHAFRMSAPPEPSVGKRIREQEAPMIRSAAALALALTLNPALVRAQDTALTVNVPSADVYKGPTTVTPIIGHVSRGTVLPISRNLGSWVKIAWPDAPDGVGYVHVTMGRLGPPSADAPVRNVSPAVS